MTQSSYSYRSSLFSQLRWLILLRQQRAIATRINPNEASATGFTLIELLVSIIIAALIVIGLLTLVVQLTGTSQRDAARSDTQREMQSAIDFVAQDLREAVYVYNGSCLGSAVVASPYCPGLVNYIPTAMSSSTRTPILAFWRTDNLPSAVSAECRTNAASATQVPGLSPQCISGKTYSLVVYALDTQSTVDGVQWPGQARLIRYIMTRYGGSAGTTVNTSALDPLPETEYTFRHWPLSPSGTASSAGAYTTPTLTAPGNSAAVLVDFVDSLATTGTACPTGMSSTAAAASTLRGFYACVSNDTGDSTIGLNQEVVLNLRGNLAGRPGFPAEANATPLAHLQTRVFIRGSVRKS
jgi:type II secretory pathway pseudopilin PulG